MKFILFCNLPYAFSILKPLEKQIIQNKFEVIWYVPKDIVELFPYKESNYTSNIDDLKEFKSDIIFVPGNDVPYFLRGLKVQVFHGLAGEKKGHFRIRDYFDLYLTQGPYFTDRFNELASKHNNFDVIETGWCKLDDLYNITQETKQYKQSLLEKYNVNNIVLYAPTFSPSLTSADTLVEQIEQLSNDDNTLVVIKFHDKMDPEIKKKYHQLNCKNLIISDEKDITKLLQISDMMISDTSSVVYEFILLDKPVLTLNSTSQNINWIDVKSPETVVSTTLDILNGNDKFKEKRETIINLYHPYNDGESAKRMIDATVSYVAKNGVPEKRKLSLLRKLKTIKHYGF